MKQFCLAAIVGIVLISVSCATSQDMAAQYYEIAEGYAETSKYDKAIIWYQKAAKAKEFENAATYGLGRMYALSGQWTDACKIFHDLYEKEPDNELLISAYAFSLASNGNTEEALVLYEKLYQKNTENPSAGKDYVAMLLLAEKYQEALAQIAILREKFPDDDIIAGLDALETKAQTALNPPEETAEESTDTNSEEQSNGSTEAPTTAATTQDSATTAENTNESVTTDDTTHSTGNGSDASD